MPFPPHSHSLRGFARLYAESCSVPASPPIPNLLEFGSQGINLKILTITYHTESSRLLFPSVSFCNWV
ncbi:hypothetical protein EVA_21744 [gut metagenome]|uniref:Uncharacterized protein n=1 Tax=gut metagenome TaxID=749906 RepID=J9FKL7_9ZZZZ